MVGFEWCSCHLFTNYGQYYSYNRSHKSQALDEDTLKSNLESPLPRLFFVFPLFRQLHGKAWEMRALGLLSELTLS